MGKLKGKRPAGKPKKKSIKAKTTINFSSKRRLSRMGKKQKKGAKGVASQYISRSQILKKLQISLRDFQKLCILKGIYPRDLGNKTPNNKKGQIFYHFKDVNYLSHEPVLNHFRKFKTFMKRMTKAIGRKDLKDARHLQKYHKPEYSLSHLVKERYPTFQDALKDMDDMLSTIHLFASLPSKKLIRPEKTQNCRKLVREWSYYIAKTKSLKYIFVSIKGIYFQAEILGENITWLLPHQFAQHTPNDVDYRVMLTFLEFYEVFGKFVNYKLYNSFNLSYPPIFDDKNHNGGLSFRLLNELDEEDLKNINNEKNDDNDNDNDNDEKLSKDQLKGLKKKLKEILKKKKEELSKNNDNDDDDIIKNNKDEIQRILDEEIKNDFNLNDNDINNLLIGEEEEEVFGNDMPKDNDKLIFQGLVFFINREVPSWIELPIICGGGIVAWDGKNSPLKKDDIRITHEIVDRPKLRNEISSRTYIQPQWVFDSFNNRILLPSRLYAPGVDLPPHLSPFVDDEKEGYIPEYRKKLEQIKDQNLNDIDDSDDDTDDNSDSDDNNLKNEEDEIDDEEVEDIRKNYKIDEENNGYDDEIETEKLINEKNNNKKKTTRSKKRKINDISNNIDEEQEQKELAISMMNKKAKRLYDRMQYGLRKKQRDIKKLEEKRDLAKEEKKKNKKNKKKK